MTALDWYKIVSDDTPPLTAIGIVASVAVLIAAAMWKVARR